MHRFHGCWELSEKLLPLNISLHLGPSSAVEPLPVAERPLLG